MNLEITVNEYLLAWYLLYGASLSKEIDKFRKNLWSKYKIEYNFCYKDKEEIIKYGKDFIPDNDILLPECPVPDYFKVFTMTNTYIHKVFGKFLISTLGKMSCVREYILLGLIPIISDRRYLNKYFCEPFIF